MPVARWRTLEWRKNCAPQAGSAAPPREASGELGAPPFGCPWLRSFGAFRTTRRLLCSCWDWVDPGLSLWKSTSLPLFPSWQGASRAEMRTPQCPEGQMRGFLCERAGSMVPDLRLPTEPWSKDVDIDLLQIGAAEIEAICHAIARSQPREAKHPRRTQRVAGLQ